MSFPQWRRDDAAAYIAGCEQYRAAVSAADEVTAKEVAQWRCDVAAGHPVATCGPGTRGQQMRALALKEYMWTRDKRASYDLLMAHEAAEMRREAAERQRDSGVTLTWANPKGDLFLGAPYADSATPGFREDAEAEYWTAAVPFEVAAAVGTAADPCGFHAQALVIEAVRRLCPDAPHDRVVYW